MGRKERRDSMRRSLNKADKKLLKLETQHRLGLAGDKFYQLERKRLKSIIKKGKKK